jgi:amino acid adenylation domain-containing protein
VRERSSIYLHSITIIASLFASRFKETSLTAIFHPSPFLDMATRMSVLNPEPQKLPGPSLLHHLIRNDVSDDTPALDYQDDTGERHQTTYRQLHHDSDRLASYLNNIREQSGRSQAERFIVPVFIGQCPELYMTQLAILKAGGAFCPITLDVPEERLRFILGDTSASMLVTTSELSARLPQLDDVLVVLADEIPDCQVCDPIVVNIESTMPAYVMYTSGSTGQPKGVVLSHSAATQALLAHDRHIPTFSRFLQFASPTFDVSVFEIFFPLFRGCTLAVCERKRMLNDLPAAINALEVDAAELTPSVANSLLQGRKSVPKLKVLLTIGEMLKQSVVEEFGGSAEEPAVLHGMYGPTEATIHCTLQSNFAKDMPVNNIGVPLDTVSAFIIRPSSAEHPSEVVEILPLGEEGELAVGGHQLADGYLNREEQTKAAFVSHPDYGDMYRTGDRAKLDSDGRLMCLGRISSGQVKLRGQVSVLNPRLVFLSNMNTANRTR